MRECDQQRPNIILKSSFHVYFKNSFNHNKNILEIYLFAHSGDVFIICGMELPRRDSAEGNKGGFGG